MWLTKKVPDVLKKLYDDGYCIIIISNQTRNTVMKTNQIIAAMSTLGIPSMILVASEDTDKKPNTTMYDMITQMTTKQIDIKKSFYVGDALGRPDDWSDSDKQFGLNIGFTNIYSPDHMFGEVDDNAVPIQSIGLVKHQEIIVMVGFPGSGKSTVASTFSNYKILHGDELVTSKKMIKEAEKHVQEGASVIFDATNPTKEKRQEYIALAHKYNLPSRCIVMQTDMAEAMFRNNKRNKIIPKITYYVFRKKYQEPTIEEGFQEIIKV
jgi:bifunctional polynucleotide phosphatase/kinase